MVSTLHSDIRFPGKQLQYIKAIITRYFLEFSVLKVRRMIINKHGFVVFFMDSINLFTNSHCLGFQCLTREAFPQEKFPEEYQKRCEQAKAERELDGVWVNSGIF